MTLTYRQEYTHVVEGSLPNVQLLQEWLVNNDHVLKSMALHAPSKFKLLMHCTEKTNASASVGMWSEVFKKLGLELEIMKTGCCGMSGTFGHETENLTRSKAIYDLSWGEVIADSDSTATLLATGYSCRSQVKRFDDVQLKHPIQALLELFNKHELFDKQPSSKS